MVILPAVCCSVHSRITVIFSIPKCSLIGVTERLGMSVSVEKFDLYAVCQKKKKIPFLITRIAVFISPSLGLVQLTIVPSNSEVTLVTTTLDASGMVDVFENWKGILPNVTCSVTLSGSVENISFVVPSEK